MSKSDKKEYRIRKIRIDKKHDLFDYCEDITLLSNNLYNAVRFRQRQVLTAVKKEVAKRTENEKEVLDEISRTIKYLNALPPKPPTENNQNFVAIPYQMLKNIIKYLANEKEIHCVCQEESYTSKASFLDHDFIPVYKKEENKTYTFSGKRGVKGVRSE